MMTTSNLTMATYVTDAATTPKTVPATIADRERGSKRRPAVLACGSLVGCVMIIVLLNVVLSAIASGAL